jgi:predicted RNA-binding protein with PIN domain
MTRTPAYASLPPLPETLFVPLLDTAADVLRELDSADVPSSLRPLVGFDRRGLTRGAARQQLLRAVDTNDAFRDLAVGRFKERRDAIAALAAWDPDDTAGVVEEAARRDALPLLASTLYAARPPGWAFGLGVVTVTFQRKGSNQRARDELKAREEQMAGLAESRRRAEAGRAAAEQQVEHLEQELREERQGRRNREVQASQVVAAAERQVEAVERELLSARSALEAAEGRQRREADRAHALEEELRELRRAREEGDAGGDGEDGAATGLPVLRLEDVSALVDAAELARRLATGLSGVAEQALRVSPPPADQEPAHQEPAPQERASDGATLSERGRRRAQPRVPPGMLEDAPDVLEAMLRTPRAVLVVDGYNVSMLAWGDAPPSQQRDRLLTAIGELQLRTRARVIVVFDGADVEGVRQPRRSGVRVVFSEAGEEADAVVVREATDLPVDMPVIVASSDNWVAEHARKADARVVSSETLLRALRR